jgi:hypothetical protein
LIDIDAKAAAVGFLFVPVGQIVDLVSTQAGFVRPSQWLGLCRGSRRVFTSTPIVFRGDTGDIGGIKQFQGLSCHQRAFDVGDIGDNGNIGHLFVTTVTAGASAVVTKKPRFFYAVTIVTNVTTKFNKV